MLSLLNTVLVVVQYESMGLTIVHDIIQCNLMLSKVLGPSCTVIIQIVKQHSTKSLLMLIPAITSPLR